MLKTFSFSGLNILIDFLSLPLQIDHIFIEKVHIFLHFNAHNYALKNARR